jgi:thymidine phosphorylase
VIVLDVKTGSGAFMRERDAARDLAQAMVDIGATAGRRMAAVVSDMSQPLGRAVGNALEVAEALDTLAGHGPTELAEFALELASLIVNLATDGSRTRDDVELALRDGAGLRAFRAMVDAQGGDSGAFEDRERLPRARIQAVVRAEADGYVARLDALLVAHAGRLLGAGRERKGEPIDLSVGLVFERKVGDSVVRGQPLATVHANDATRLAEAEAMLRSAVQIDAEPVARPPLILERLTGSSTRR